MSNSKKVITQYQHFKNVNAQCQNLKKSMSSVKYYKNNNVQSEHLVFQCPVCTEVKHTMKRDHFCCIFDVQVQSIHTAIGIGSKDNSQFRGILNHQQEWKGVQRHIKHFLHIGHYHTVTIHRNCVCRGTSSTVYFI